MTEDFNNVHCDICGSEAARLRYVTRSYGRGDDRFIIENIPVVSCPACGESYMTAATLHEIERLERHRHAVAEEKAIDVVNFSSPRPPEAA